MKIVLDLPEKLPFSTELDVRIGEINYGQHLGNDAMLRLLHEARLRFLRQYGFSEADTGGAALIMADATVIFKAQALHGDQLRIEIGLTEPGRCNFAMLYRVRRIADGRDIAFAQTGLVFFDYPAQRVVRMPEKFLAAMRTAEAFVQ